MNQQKPQGAIKMNVNINDFPIKKCARCQGIFWDPVYILREVPALQSKSGKPEMVSIQTWSCIVCHSLHDQPSPDA